MKVPISTVQNRDNMEAMREFPDKYFDLAVVDPPYGIGVTQMTLGNGKTTTYGKGKDWDTSAPDMKYFHEVFRVSKNQIVWGANNMIQFLKPTSGWIFWDKKTGGNDFSDGELAWTSFGGALRKYTKGWVGNNAKDYGLRIHPTQKPVALYKWLLTNYAKPGDKILDTHLGSGSSRIAAYDMGFDFWGYELDADYFAAMEARFQAHISKPVLFAPEQMYRFEQAELFTPENLESR